MALTRADLAAIVSAAGADARTALAMLTGAYLESGANPDASGGGAYGVWQLQGNPQGADTAYAAGVMEPRYAAAAAQVPESLWQSNPEAAAERTAYLAERPAADYFATQGQGRVDSAYQFATGGAAGAAAVNGPATGSTTIQLALPAGLGSIDTGIPNAAGMSHYLIIALGAVGGLVLIVLGAQRASGTHPVAAAKTGAGDTAKAAAVV